MDIFDYIRKYNNEWNKEFSFLNKLKLEYNSNHNVMKWIYSNDILLIEIVYDKKWTIIVDYEDLSENGFILNTKIFNKTDLSYNEMKKILKFLNNMDLN